MTGRRDPRGGSASSPALDDDRLLNDERYAVTRPLQWMQSSASSVILAAYLAVAVPTHGWIPFLLVGVAALTSPLSLLLGKPISENVYAVGQTVWMGSLGVAAAMTGGADSFLLPLCVAYALIFFSLLSPGKAVRFSVVGFLLCVLPIIVLDWEGLLRSPWLLLSCCVGFITIVLVARAMAVGEIAQRSQATIDPLTGLLNRRSLSDRVAQLTEQARVMGDGTSLALVTGDIDHFKQVNDTHGHQRGDDVLRDVAYLIRKTVRRFELVYRMGGEEFLVLLPGHDLAEAGRVAERIRAAVEHGQPGGVDVTISLGVVEFGVDRSDLHSLLARADAALYTAKREGRNRVVLASDVTPPAVLP
ncbi:MAG: GGDEF domain-containing protein [Propionibacteriaceae bacterium]|nr:GGDEF domain-containing protein [Propionibacteriaceae bacterium]